MRVTHLLSFMSLLAYAPGIAQMQLQFDPNIPVTRNGQLLDLAWAGGLNFAQASRVDLNGDGIKDLVLFDRSGNQLITLLNDGSPGTGAYRITRDHDMTAPFQGLHDWVLFRDYDCDGKEDIFTYSSAGFAVYRNISNSNGPAFQLVNSQVRSDYVGASGGSVNANLYISSVDLPGFADVDGDGDLDVLTFSLFGTSVEYHKNLSMELYGTCDSLKFELRNKCWGFFTESFSDNSVTLDAECQFNVPNPEIGGGTERSEGEDEDGGPRAHAGSSLTPLDLDGDGVLELLLGDISFNNLVGLYNGGTVDLAFMVDQDTLFPSYDQSLDLAVFPSGYYVDVDNDGKRDLLVSPNATSLSQNFQSMWYYRNAGTDAAPVFEYQQRDLFQNRMLEFGEGALPVLFDHNGDGLMDLLVANHGYFETGGAYTGKIALLLNTGTASTPAFTLATDDYMSLSNSGIGLSMFPAFADLDGDGDKDMYIGDLQGRIHYFQNISAGPVAQFQLAQPNINDSSGEMIDVGQFATPIFTDLDGDGLTDMIVGERNGNLNYFRNSGSAQAPAWSLVSESLGNVSTTEYWNITGHSVPFLYMNEDGEREMLLGSESGWLHRYGNIDGNMLGNWTRLDSTFMDRRDGIRTGVCLHDFTGDGKLDLVIGNYRGGLSFWRSDAPSGAGIGPGAALPAFSMYPNPATATVILEAEGNDWINSQWVIRNGMGQLALSQPSTGNRTIVDLGGLAAGAYLVRLEGATTSATQRLMVLEPMR